MTHSLLDFLILSNNCSLLSSPISYFIQKYLKINDIIWVGQKTLFLFWNFINKFTK